MEDRSGEDCCDKIKKYGIPITEPMYGVLTCNPHLRKKPELHETTKVEIENSETSEEEEEAGSVMSDLYDNISNESGGEEEGSSAFDGTHSSYFELNSPLPRTPRLKDADANAIHSPSFQIKSPMQRLMPSKIAEKEVKPNG